MVKRAPCSLYEAWHTYWDALFPGEAEWETVLVRWVKDTPCGGFAPDMPVDKDIDQSPTA